MILPIRSNKGIWSRSGSSKPKKLLHGWNMLECRWVSPTNWGQDYYQQVGRTACLRPRLVLFSQEISTQCPNHLRGEPETPESPQAPDKYVDLDCQSGLAMNILLSKPPKQNRCDFLPIVDRGSHRYTHYFREKAGGTCGQLWRSMFTSWFTNPPSYSYSML